MEGTFLGGRVVAAPRTVALAAGDVAMIAAFAVVGELRHGGDLVAILETLLQFGAGWAVAAVALGAYGPRAIETPVRAAALGLGVWTVGALVGQLVRVATEPAARLDPAFVLVSVIVGGVLVASWRAVAAIRL